jgi:hypothetical protein
MTSSTRLAIFVCTLAASAQLNASSGTCVRPEENPVVKWSTTGAVAGGVRVYFRAENARGEHFIEMSRGGAGVYWAALPRVAEGTTRIDYRLAGRAGVTLSEGSIAVSDSCAPSRPDAAVIDAARQMVIGTTSRGPALPVGFLCQGVSATIDGSGDLRAYRCRERASLTAAVGSAVPSTSTGVARRTSRDVGASDKSRRNVRTTGTNTSNGSNGEGHYEHGNGNGYGHCKDHQGPALGHEEDEDCDQGGTVSNSRPQ